MTERVLVAGALDQVGVLDELRQHCLTVERICRIDPSTSSVDIDTSVRLHCEQAHLVASLERTLARLPRTQVRYSAPVRSVRLGAGGVVVATSDEKLRGHWLIGADGAQSTVRRCVGVDAVATADSHDIVVGRAASDLATASPELEPATFIRTSAGDAAVLQTSAMAARVADQLDGIVTEDDVARVGEQRRHAALSVSARSPGGTQRHARGAVGGGAHT